MVSPRPGVRLRPLTAQDIPFLPEALYQALYTSPGEAPLSREVILLPELFRYIEGWGQRDGDLGTLALGPNETFLGAAWLRLFPRDSPGYGFLDPQTPELSVSVVPQGRGQGIGTHLIEATLAQASHRFSAVSLSVTPGNPALRLYERLGFQIVRHNPNDIVMRRLL